MDTQPIKHWGYWPRYAVLGLLVLSGFAIAIAGAALHPAIVETSRLLGNIGPVKALCIAAAGTVIFLLLVRYAEVALALFFLVGLVKGDPRLESAPVDLTVFTAVILLVGVAWRLLVWGRELRLPREYLVYVPLLAVMIVSLSYTPNFTAGLVEVLRFICLTGIGIVAPFILFDTATKLRRFLYILVLGGIGVSINSLTQLGGGERFVAPSGLNTELGAASAVAIVIVWGLILPRLSFLWRMLYYPVLGVLVIALLGSGGRFASVSTVVCVLLGAFLCRPLLKDLAVICCVAALALPLIWIPSASYNYLESLRSPSQAMGTREDLMALGIKIFEEHPLLGVGVDGYRFVSPNPITYNFPHNAVLELGSEMGVVAALCFVFLAFFSFREAFRQLATRTAMDAPLVQTVLMLLIYGFLDSMISGDINDLRFTWFVFALPFVLRGLHGGSFFREIWVMERRRQLQPAPSA
jgi:O-antigen ligase